MVIKIFSCGWFQAVEIVDDDESGSEKEQPVFIDHEHFYEGRVFGQLKSSASVHLEVKLLRRESKRNI